jgi:hypothetical protein
MDSSKSPFDDPKFPGPDESAGSNPASATGIFGKVTPPPAPSTQEDDWLKSLLRTETPPDQGSVEATAVTPSPHAPAGIAPASAPPSNNPGSFTQMFEALGVADARPSKIESAPTSNAESAPPIPATPAPAKPAADLTSVFTAISVGKSPAFVAPPATPTASAAESKPGEFTQLLQTLNTPVLKTESEPSSPPVVETPSASAEPGSFTQLFKKAPAQTAAPEASFSPAHIPEGEPPASAPVSGSGTGAFTQLFQTLSPDQKESSKPAAAVSTPPVAAPPVATPLPQPQPAVTEGFTQMFQSLSPKTEPAPMPPSASSAAFEPPEAQPKSGPGAFTQMFSQIGGQSVAQENTLASLKQESVPQSNFQFSTPAPVPGANPFGTSAPRPDPTSPAQGGFTQLFQALGTENKAPAKEPPLIPSSPAAPNPAPPAAGGFTQLLRTLNADSSPPQQAAPPQMASSPAPPSPMSSSGPGELTRIISGSMLREAQDQNVAPGPPVIPSGGQPAGAGQPGISMPRMQMPQPPAFPKMPPGAPPVPSMQAGGGAAPQMPHFQPPPFAFPPAPAPPVPQPGKLQQYLPLILVVNVFVLIVVILIVVFALRHH